MDDGQKIADGQKKLHKIFVQARKQFFWQSAIFSGGEEFLTDCQQFLSEKEKNLAGSFWSTNGASTRYLAMVSGNCLYASLCFVTSCLRITQRFPTFVSTSETPPQSVVPVFTSGVIKTLRSQHHNRSRQNRASRSGNPSLQPRPDKAPQTTSTLAHPFPPRRCLYHPPCMQKDIARWKSSSYSDRNQTHSWLTCET